MRAGIDEHFTLLAKYRIHLTSNQRSGHQKPSKPAGAAAIAVFRAEV